MIHRLLISVLILSFSSSGCIFLLADALTRGSSKKAPPVRTVRAQEKRSPEKRAAVQKSGPIQDKMIEGSREDVFNTAVTVLLNKGYYVQTSDYDAGRIIADKEDPDYLMIKIAVEEKSGTRIRMRVAISDRTGPLDDARFVAQIFDDVQGEVFSRQARRQKMGR